MQGTLHKRAGLTMALQIQRNIAPLALKGGVVLFMALTLGACSSARFGSSSQQAYGGSSAPIYAQPEPVEAIPSGPVSTEPLPPLEGTAPVEGSSEVASLPPITPAAPPPASRMSLVGGWTAKDATGGACRVVLSSTPALDLYRATTSGCSNKDLARISAWDFRDGEVYLYQSGGTMAARLRAQGSAMNGALTKSGAPLTMSR